MLKFRARVAGVVSVGMLMVAACGGQTADLGGAVNLRGSGSGAGDAAVDDGAVLGPLGLPENVTIANLTDGQAESLCAWLAQEFAILDPSDPAAADPLIDLGGTSTGYAGGPGETCSAYIPAEANYGPESGTWVLLNTQYCLLNLRHSPCAATVGQLVECIGNCVASYALGAAGTIAEENQLAYSCGAFLAAPACEETVLQANFALAPPCDVGVPIAPGASCPDGGT